MTPGAGSERARRAVAVDDLVADVIGDALAPGSVHVVVVPGGAVHTVVRHLVRGLGDAGVSAHELVCSRSGSITGSMDAAVVVVGEAQWADEPLAALLERTEAPAPAVVLVHRDAPLTRGLALAHQAARRSGTVAVLAPATAADITRTRGLPAAEADRLVALTGGRVDLVEAYVADGDLDLDVRARLALVDDQSRRAVELLAFGAGTGDLVEVLGAEQTDRSLAALVIEGLLWEGGMAEGVAAAVRRLATSARRASVIEQLGRTSGATIDLATLLRDLDDRSPAAAEVYVRAAELIADAEPATALDLVRAAIVAGADARATAIATAIAALAAGDPRRALLALADAGDAAQDDAHDDGRAAERATLTAAAWIASGDLEAAVDPLRRCGHAELERWVATGIGAVVPGTQEPGIGHSGIGHPTTGYPATAAPPAATADAALADAVSCWLDDRADDCLDVADVAVRRGAADGTAHRRPVSIDAAAAALHGRFGDLEGAQRLLAAALAERTGGAIHRRGLLAMSAWVAARRGHLDEAARTIADEVAGGLSPNDAVWLAGARCALAVRSPDADGLDAAAAAGISALAACPGHLHHVDALADIAAAVARTGLPGRDPLAGAERAAARLAHARPQVDLSWARLAAALSSDDASRVADTARAFIAVGGDASDTSTRPEVSSRVAAATCLVSMLDGEVDAAVAERVATDLAGAGWIHEAARLCGLLATASRRENDGRRLLKQSRSFRAERTQLRRTEAVDRTVVRLSEQELRVAQMVLDGHTHRSIGAALFISAKTVEHHVAHIRTKLGASTRAEMLAAIRAYVEGINPS